MVCFYETHFKTDNNIISEKKKCETKKRVGRPRSVKSKASPIIDDEKEYKYTPSITSSNKEIIPVQNNDNTPLPINDVNKNNLYYTYSDYLNTPNVSWGNNLDNTPVNKDLFSFDLMDGKYLINL